ncbi:uncharacterized protein K02A2.6-like [Gigantopelta aegis]|uniref:uncharacterized protein K02A2.6-like n=1 Tax=Gigantopelta aegis TaxID=1735272 RepID=UPI001B887FE9|nr:uncharacterized protein K02A2.6-like [Gigantopelta aegis]
MSLQKSKKVHQVDESKSDSESESDETALFYTTQKRKSDVIWVHPKVEGIDFPMELDTGSALSIISTEFYNKHFKHLPLQSTKVVMKTYTGEKIKPKGLITVEVEQNSQKEQLELYVIENGGPPLFGRSWLEKIKLDWMEIKNLSSVDVEIRNELKDTLDRHSDVFKDALGTVKGMEVKFSINDDASPKFIKARPVPYSLRKPVDDEIDRLVKEGILESVDFSDWATPVVPVVKKNGSVRLCCDFKVTIKPVLNSVQYPLPRIEDLFATLSGGKQFIKIDLANAYQQLKFDKEAQKYLVIKALALVFGVKKFHQYLYSRKFTLVTDHRPLTKIFGSKTGIPTLAAARLQRWTIFLAAHDYEIVYKNSESNANAYGLSQLPLKFAPNEKCHTVDIFNISQIERLPIKADDIRKYTRKDPTLSKVLDLIQTGWYKTQDPALQPDFIRKDELTIHQGCLMWGMRVIVPPKLQLQVLEELHSAHSGIVKMKELARSYFWWPKLDSHIEDLVESCEECQQIQKMPGPAPLHPWSFPDAPWKRLHIDFAGPFHGHMYLVVVDSHSKWPEVFIMKTTTAEKTIEILRGLFCRYGLSLQIVSDNGPQFVSASSSTF